MRYNEAKEQALHFLSIAQRLFVKKIVRCIFGRYSTFARLYEQGLINPAATQPAPSINNWLNGRMHEETYLVAERSESKSRGFTKPRRQEWTTQRVIKEAREITIGANQSIDWFLMALGKELTRRIPGYVVTVHKVASTSSEHPSSETISFVVKRAAKLRP